MATPNFDNIVAGPAQVKLTDVEIGHTAGGVTANITPQNRPRVVDQFGGAECAIIHTGDQVRITVPFAEWTATTLAEVYNPGLDSLTGGSSGGRSLGFGRSAGYIYVAQDLKIIPRLAADANKRLQIFRATPVGALQLSYKAEDDRILSTEFAGLVDESETDGQLIGKLQLGS